jgi:hypothetical protein
LGSGLVDPKTLRCPGSQVTIPVMQPICEVCENFHKQARRDDLKIVEVKFPERPVLLCSGHAKIADNSGVESFEQLRDLYGSGRRSYVPRRRPAQLQPSGIGRDPGRRATDR